MAGEITPLVVNGWKIFAHPLFLDQLEEAIRKAEKSRKKHPKDYLSKNPSKHLNVISKVAFEMIPSDPTSKEYRQGGTLGSTNKHWFRASFQQQYRLFFQYNTQSKIIVLVWVNDEECLRAYGSKTDAYAVFQKMLGKGHPPSSWDELLSEAQSASARFKRILYPPTGLRAIFRFPLK